MRTMLPSSCRICLNHSSYVCGTAGGAGGVYHVSTVGCKGAHTGRAPTARRGTPSPPYLVNDDEQMLVVCLLASVLADGVLQRQQLHMGTAGRAVTHSANSSEASNQLK